VPTLDQVREGRSFATHPLRIATGTGRLELRCSKPQKHLPTPSKTKPSGSVKKDPPESSENAWEMKKGLIKGQRKRGKTRLTYRQKKSEKGKKK